MSIMSIDEVPNIVKARIVYIAMNNGNFKRHEIVEAISRVISEDPKNVPVHKYAVANTYWSFFDKASRDQSRRG